MLISSFLCYTPELHGIDRTILMWALKLLEHKGKLAIFKGTSADDEGVKFSVTCVMLELSLWRVTRSFQCITQILPDHTGCHHIFMGLINGIFLCFLVSVTTQCIMSGVILVWFAMEFFCSFFFFTSYCWLSLGNVFSVEGILN